MKFPRLAFCPLIVACVIAVTASLAPRPAAAGSYVMLTEQSFSTTLTGVGAVKMYNCGQLPQSSISNAQSTSYSTSSGGASMSASMMTDAVASFGHLGGTAFATADNEGLNAGAHVVTQMVTMDVITAVGTPEADGYIHLPFLFNLNDTITASGNFGPSSVALARF
jgi:hypothetical protein